jgi:hypothetical protein
MHKENMKLSNRLKTRGNTKPLKNTLVNRAASKLTANQIMNLLKKDLVLLKNTQKAIEHRAGDLRSLNSFMKNYYRKKYM